MDIDRATRDLLERNEELIQKRVEEFDEKLGTSEMYCNFQLPEKLECSGEAEKRQTVPIQIDLAQHIRNKFKGRAAPSMVFVKQIDVVHASLKNDRGSRLIFSAHNEDCGQCVPTQTSLPVNPGTMLILNDGMTVNGLPGVYNAGDFAEPGGLFSKYAEALMQPFEERVSRVHGSPNVIYTSTYNDSEVKEETVSSEDADSREADDSPRLDCFLRLMHQNLDSLSTPPVATKKPGERNEYVYTLDIASGDMDLLKESAEKQIYEPLKKHLIDLRPSSKSSETPAFTICVTTEKGVDAEGKEQMWPSETKLNMMLKLTLSHFS